MKKKALLSSILVIVMCVSIIAGSTLALFTNEDDFDITLTSGKVDVDGYVDALETYSVTGDVNGTIVDENGNTYSYVGPLTDANGLDVFTNTGTAEFDGSVLQIERITPGDKVKFEIRSKNTGNVAAQTRFTIDCLSGFRLMEGLVITVYNYDEATNAYVVRDTEKAVDTYTSIWTDLPKDGDIVNAIVEIELPVAAGNEYQDQSTEINVLVEAVQFNGVVENEQTSTVKHIEAVEDAAALQNAINNPDNTYVLLTEDIAGATFSGDVSSKVIDADGHAVTFGTSNANFDNVTIKNLGGSYTGTVLTLGSSKGTLTVTDSAIATTANDSILMGGASELDLTVENCQLSGGNYAIRSTGSVKSIVIKETNFENKSGWAIMLNGTVLGSIVIDKCTFTNCEDGIAKAGVGDGVNSGAIDEYVQFTNNVIVDSYGHDYLDKLGTAKEQPRYYNFLALKYHTNATVVVNGNTLDGAAWTPNADNGFTTK